MSTFPQKQPFNSTALLILFLLVGKGKSLTLILERETVVKVSVADILSDSSVIGTMELAAAAGKYCPELVISLSIFYLFCFNLSQLQVLSFIDHSWTLKCSMCTQIYVLSPKYSGLLFFFSPPVAGLTNGRPVRDSNPGAPLRKIWKRKWTIAETMYSRVDLMNGSLRKHLRCNRLEGCYYYKYYRKKCITCWA